MYPVKWRNENWISNCFKVLPSKWFCWRRPCSLGGQGSGLLLIPTSFFNWALPLWWKLVLYLSLNFVGFNFRRKKRGESWHSLFGKMGMQLLYFRKLFRQKEKVDNWVCLTSHCCYSREHKMLKTESEIKKVKTSPWLWTSLHVCYELRSVN